MSLEDEGEKQSLESSIETERLPRKPSLRYTREFLLSFGDLDACKKLPGGLDESFVSEFETLFSNVCERGIGGLPSYSSKRGDYGSLPSRFDSSSSYPRGGSGRWDTRSSGSSDRDGDLQSERESSMQESGRRFGNQARRFWQHQEHDGLLGSGAFPRPPGYTGASAPKGRGNGHYQLSRSTEPYQPPRPYKAVPHSRREHTDSVNDETFGSSEFSTQDRAEEEKRRRESFELMRKEQQKALKEKHKQTPDNHKENLGDVDLIALLETSEEHKSKQNENMLEVSAPPSNSQIDSSRSSLIHVPPSRPLVPPGFASVMLEKTLSVEPSNTCTPEARTAVINDKSHVNYPDNTHEEVIRSDSGGGTIENSVNFEKDLGKKFSLQEANEIWENENGLSNPKELRPKIVSSDQPSSILDKLFGSALSTNFSTSPSIIEHQGHKAHEDIKSPAEIESSKFAHWFFDEVDKKAVDDFSSKNLLSLIINKEEVTSHVSEFSLDKNCESVKPSLPFKNLESVHRQCEFPAAAAPVTIPTPYHQSDSQETSSGVLTCEDLEQSILAEVKDNSSVLWQSVQGPWMQLDHELEGHKATVDDHASEHLLSLLRKGTDSKESILPAGIDLMVSPTDRIDISDGKASSDSTSIKGHKKAPSSEKALTLEALFGAAFMSELHSVDAPLSVQRGSVDEPEIPESLELHPSYKHNTLVSPALGEVQAYKITSQGNEEAFTHTQQGKANKVPGLGYGHNNDSSNMGLKLGDPAESRAVAVDIHLPEEDSLITDSDSFDRIASDPALLRVLNRNEGPLEQPSDSVLMAILRNTEHTEQGHLPQPNFLEGPSGIVDSDKLHHLHGWPSSQFPHPMNQVRPLFPPMEHHGNMHPQMRLIGSENIRPELQHPFAANVFPQHVLHSGDRPQFDPVGHHPMFQHMPMPMPMPGNLPAPHPHHGFPRGVPPPYSMSPMEGYMAEMNNMHGFPLNQRPPNFGARGMGMPGPAIGSGGGGNPPLLNRLIEMELRANPKQIHSAAPGQIPGVYGPELDMSLRYR
ncbi:uncharacterized protein LOC120271987 isoform X1 [Dioscorea cayenensis subsp. rotundata]|uniref:Uncharacterized protein LOC120271987 isoform X1 n=1 Tax=Dioscorea cayennensis subsp. rotundata TaxID=55577 RepID=A0AB40C6R5_DIOCR|nr:uncharacterized protein LOC120271987 isoform X1 [Dioscorea cayenensis subsp. rotundata]XP_039134616.1 uncharacterized protein LOC120271987 isoform X1 [Dioscorea cayenensis subsp. rotundata]